MQQIVLRSPDELIELIDTFTGGVHLKSRNQLLNIALIEWLAKQHFPEVPLTGFSHEDFVNQSIRRTQLIRELTSAFYEDIDDEQRKGILSSVRKRPASVWRDQEVIETLSRLLIQSSIPIPESPQPKQTPSDDTEKLKSEIKEELRNELRGEIIADLLKALSKNEK